jgi:hypothetical protein
MSIRDPVKFMEGHWDWKFIDDVLPGRMKVSDIDGIIEKNRHFLVLEGKKPKIEIPLGQKIMLEALWKTGNCTVVYLWGEHSFVEEMEVLYPNGSRSKKKAADIQTVQKFIKWWINKVEGEKS